MVWLAGRVAAYAWCAYCLERDSSVLWVARTTRLWDNAAPIVVRRGGQTAVR